MTLSVYFADMGGAANDVQRGLTAASTFGLSEAGSIPGTGKIGRQVSNASKNAAVFTPGYLVAAGVRSAAGAQTLQNAPRDAARASAAAMSEQNRLAAEAEKKLALQPKKTASDDFLANKNKMLQNMRLGLMSSVGGTAGAAAPSLSAPSLTGKSKLGA